MKRTYTPITEANAKSFIGATVQFNWGAMHGTSEIYTVTAVKTTRWGTELIAMNAEGAEKTISGFTTMGIGAYVLEMAEA